MDWDRKRRFDDRRGGESYRPMSSTRPRLSPSRSYIRHARSPPRTRSPRLVADTWVPSTSRTYDRLRTRSPPLSRRRSRSPSFYRDTGPGSFRRARSPRRFSPPRNDRARSPRQILWRSRSPYSEGRSRDTSCRRATPVRLRESSPPNQDFRYSNKDRFTSSLNGRYTRADSPPRRPVYRPRTSIALCSRSPIQRHRERRQDLAPRQSSASPSKEAPPAHCSASVSGTGPRHSSPHIDKGNLAPFDPASSTTQQTPLGRFSRSAGRLSPNHEYPYSLGYQSSGQDGISVEGKSLVCSAKRHDLGKHNLQGFADRQDTTSNIPTQPKAYSASMNQIPPSGPSHGPRSLSSQTRGPNISLLSAPTRPRGSSGLKDNIWAGVQPRRGAMSVAQVTPSGPRGNNLASAGHGPEPSQHPLHRSHSTANTGYRIQNMTKHLACLHSIIPGGKLFPSSFEPATEKRLLQLETDKTRLVDQAMQVHGTKRSGMRDWDRLDRESSVSTLKSELAEGHLQRITDGESVLHPGTTF